MNLYEKLVKIAIHNWVINPWCREGHFLAMDEFMENLVRALKVTYNPGGKHFIGEFDRKDIAKCVIYHIGVLQEVEKVFRIRHKIRTTRHKTQGRISIN
jgi:hypothetical protein